MSVPDISLETAPIGTEELLAQQTAVRSARLPVYLACTALAILTNYLLGKEIAWDTLNYHLYAGLSALQDRFAQDYFGAGTQGYLNPYAYVPFYLMVHAGMPALAIASVLAALHSVMLWLVFELALAVCPNSYGTRTRIGMILSSVVLAFINPVLLQEIGTSFADITTGTLALGGWVLLARAIREPGNRRVVGAGILLGAAAALKLTNALHAAAAVAMLAFLPGTVTRRVRSAGLYVAAVVSAFVVVSAPWAWHLEHAFGNPFFPLLNGLFRSPHFITAPIRDYRFIPANLGEALWRPFEMVLPLPLIHVELRAPDVRYAFIVVLGAAFLGVWTCRMLRSSALAPVRALRDSGPLLALACGFLLDWTLWLYGSGNSRYFLPMGCVAAVLATGLLFQLCAAHSKVRNYILLAIFGIQALQLWMGTDGRYNPERWDGGAWFQVVLPKEAANTRALYLKIGLQSDSFLAAFLAPSAGFIDLTGAYPLSPRGANAAQVARLVREYWPNVRVLSRSLRFFAPHEHLTPPPRAADDALEPFGLRTDASDCATITVNGLHPDWQFSVVSPEQKKNVAPYERDTTYVLSCGVIPISGPDALLAREVQADRAFDHLEMSCPQLFQPRGLVTTHRNESSGDYWARAYLSTGLSLSISHGRVEMRDPVRGGTPIDLGSMDDWARAPLPLICGRRAGRYYAFRNTVP